MAFLCMANQPATELEALEREAAEFASLQATMMGKTLTPIDLYCIR